MLLRRVCLGAWFIRKSSGSWYSAAKCSSCCSLSKLDVLALPTHSNRCLKCEVWRPNQECKMLPVSMCMPHSTTDAACSVVGSACSSLCRCLSSHPEHACVCCVLHQIQCGRQRILQAACPASAPLSVSDGIWQGGCDGFLRWLEAYAARLTAGGDSCLLLTCLVPRWYPREATAAFAGFSHRLLTSIQLETFDVDLARSAHAALQKPIEHAA